MLDTDVTQGNRIILIFFYCNFIELYLIRFIKQVETQSLTGFCAFGCLSITVIGGKRDGSHSNIGLSILKARDHLLERVTGEGSDTFRSHFPIIL